MTHVVAEQLRDRARRAPESPFLKYGPADWVSIGALDRVTDQLAAGLAEIGVSAGDRVAVLCGNRVETVELFFACSKLGAIHVPINYYLRGAFLSAQLADCSATVIVADSAGWAMAAAVLAETAIEQLVCLDDFSDDVLPNTPYARLRSSASSPPTVALAAADIVSILYTSGTTGASKGCMLSSGYHVNAALAVEAPGFVRDGDRMLSCFPHFHASWQLNTLMPALVNGASIVVEPEFHASTFMQRAADVNATVIWGLATMAMTLLAQPPRDSDGHNSLRLCIWATMEPDSQLEFERRFACQVIAEAYGQTEAVPITIEHIDTPARIPYAEGRESPMFEVGIVDSNDAELPVGEVGQIVVRPRVPLAMFSGYWGRPDATMATFRNLWHHTGDLGRLDADGRLYFVDRVKDAIRRRGENISCFELETSIGRHPEVAEVAATGVPSPLGDQDVKVSLVLRDATSGGPRYWFDYFKQTLPYYAVPRFVEIRNALPRTATYRIQKDVLRNEGIHAGLWDFEALGFAVAREDRRR